MDRLSDTNERYTSCDSSRVLCVFTTHPVFYQLGWIRRLSRFRRVVVIFASDESLGIHTEVDFGGPIDFEQDIEGLTCHFLSRSCRGQIDSGPQSQVEGLVPLVRRLRPCALVVTGWGTSVEWRAIMATRWLRVPLILRTEATLRHQFGFPVLRPAKMTILGHCARTASAVLTIGTLNREFYRHLGVPDARLFHTPYAVDNEYFMAEAECLRPNKESQMRGLGLDPRCCTILFSGKLIQRKRPDILLDVHVELLKQGLRTNVIFVGDGPMRSELEKRVREQGLSNVRFPGFQSQKCIGRWYSLGDVFVFPSSFETWGLVVNEAMCFGMPVVTTDMVGAGPDLVVDGRNGYVCTSADVGMMAKRVSLLAADEELRKRAGAESLCRIRSWSYAEDVEGILSALQSIGPIGAKCRREEAM